MSKIIGVAFGLALIVALGFGSMGPWHDHPTVACLTR
jgi:hypothetical protein